MSGAASLPPDRVPTLTEVVTWQEGTQATWPTPAAEVAAGVGQAAEAALPLAPDAAWLALTQTQLTHEILANVQRQIDLLLEYRLREALAPVLARAADGLIRDARGELASTLRDVVARAVAQELSRHRTS